jgi:uncharacterized membrane protein
MMEYYLHSAFFFVQNSYNEVSLVNYLFVSNPDGDIKYIIKKSTMLMKGYEKQITLLYLSFIGW